MVEPLGVIGLKLSSKSLAPLSASARRRSKGVAGRAPIATIAEREVGSEVGADVGAEVGARSRSQMVAF